MKLIGGDSGRYEHEELVDQVLLAPRRRAVVDVLFERPGSSPWNRRTRLPRARLDGPVAGLSSV